ncbi:DUF1700 domain-containing protein [Bacillus sp. FJAT-49711]|uniref:HAAS signaling domain-containing protein n=1 Tax=Bacillus sp. FJAT-49711 TaxID=2833585 RepID=UPI001BC936C9|nr:DUF1700 domain-containing protein [Bacillus sp. FJAT-49711]MBS4219850.1 DUF1700 domain-containing protein [Bacillus sp. FJAT-49711]
MNKYQFMRVLDSSLQKLRENERLEILQDFEEHFTIGLEEGKTEEQIVESLGSPHQIAKEILATHHLEKVQTKASTGNVFRAVWAVIGLGFFNLVIVLGPFIAIAAIIIAGWVTGVSFIVSPLLVLVNVAIFPGTFEYFDLFISMALCGIGLFIAIGMFFATRSITNVFIRYLKFNARLVKGGLKNE